MLKLILPIVFFIAGFLVHAHLLPEVDLYTLKVLPNPTISTQAVPAQTASNNDDTFLTKIDYDGQKFSRHKLTVTTASYVVITNTSKDKQMWLESNNPLLATPRGYAESEAINVRLDTKGQFVVSDKNNPAEKLEITVK